jgi:hypothetical protein
MTIDLKDAALELYGNFYIFPCKPGTKIPAVKGWQTMKMSAQEIAEWWTNHPDHNIGMCPKLNEIVVVDVDLYKPECTFDLEAVTDEGGQVTAWSPRGGAHIYYSDMNKDWRNTLRDVDGVDIKHNGVIILPPSVNAEGEAYTWEGDELVIDDAPDWLLEGAAKDAAPPSQTSKETAALKLMGRGDDGGRLIDLVMASANTLNDREDWLAVGRGLFYEYSGGPMEVAARDAFTVWSAGWGGTSAIEEELVTEARRVWDSFEPVEEVAARGGKQITGGTVHHLLAKAPVRDPIKMDDDGYIEIDGEQLLGTELPDIEWLIEDMLPAGDLISFAGPSGAGKTRYISLLLACLLTGRTDVMGLPRAVSPIPTLYVANEEKGEDLQRRIKAAMSANGLRGGCKSFVRGKDSGRIRFLHMVEGKLVPNYPLLDKLIEKIKKEGIKFVVFDPFNTLGGEEENSAASVDQIMNCFSYISREGKCAVCFIHHTPKDRAESPDALSGDGNAWRGSGAIYSGLDEGFTLFPYLPPECVSGRDAKSMRRKLLQAQRDGKAERFIIVEHAKQREGQSIPATCYQFVSEPVRKNGPGIGALKYVDTSYAEMRSSDAVSGFAVLADATRRVVWGEALVRLWGEGEHELNLVDIDHAFVRDQVEHWPIEEEAKLRTDRGRGHDFITLMNEPVTVGDYRVVFSKTGNAGNGRKAYGLRVHKVTNE